MCQTYVTLKLYAIKYKGTENYCQNHIPYRCHISFYVHHPISSSATHHQSDIPHCPPPYPWEALRQALSLSLPLPHCWVSGPEPYHSDCLHAHMLLSSTGHSTPLSDLRVVLSQISNSALNSLHHTQLEEGGVEYVKILAKWVSSQDYKCSCWLP